MGELIALLLPFLFAPKDYNDLLKKLASFAFYWTYAITLTLRENQSVDSFFNEIESWGTIGKVVSIIPHYDALNISGFFIAFAVAVLTHTFRLHDRISDVFGIRRRFDCKHILMPLAERVGSPIPNEKRTALVENRDKLMRAVFYKYASSRAQNPLVDRHDIEHALSAWSWFWVFVEGVFYFIVGALIAWGIGSPNIALAFLAVAFVFFILALGQRPRLNRYALPQIDAIAADPTASYEVRMQFNAL
ncbi:hypothetical protein JS562_48065 [Agrobacterium sp. S2]|nr:hypothetical protein [Agrobacterium sp. S2]